MATITREIECNDPKLKHSPYTKVVWSGLLDPNSTDVYSMTMYIIGNKVYSWFISVNNKPTPRCDILWDDRFILLSVLRRHFGNEFSNFETEFTCLQDG